MREVWILFTILFSITFTGFIIDLLFHKYEDDGIPLP